MKKIIINGYFTAEYISGIPRYATEIVKRIDLLCNDKSIELIVPNNAPNIPSLSNIKIVKLGNICGATRWGFMYYQPYVKKCKGLNINFTNRAEMVKHSITALHDTIPLRKDEYNMDLSKREKQKLKTVQFKSRIAFRIKTEMKKRYSDYIITVSEFSKQCLLNNMKINEKKVEVIGNGWEHINDIDEFDEKRDERIVKQQFYFFIGSLFPHKNITWILKEAQLMKETIFVIAGRMHYDFIKNVNGLFDNVIFLGYISDSYMKYLMKNCKALLFPSLEEGFGIPVLEAIALGTKVIASDIPIFRELYNNSVFYIDPNDEAVNLDILLQNEVSDPQDVLSRYSWDVSAHKWINIIEKVIRT